MTRFRSGIRYALAVSISVLAACGARFPGAAAQTFGDVTKVDSAGLAAECSMDPITGLTARVQVQRGPQLISVRNLPTVLQTRDGVRVHSSVGAIVMIDPANTATRLIFAPSLVCAPTPLSGDSVVRGIQRRRAAWGVFSVLRENAGTPRERYVVSVERGALLVHWEHRLPLFVRAAGDTATIRGTTVLVAVDSTGSQGLLFLQNGAATIASRENSAVAAGSLLHLRAGRAATPLGANLARARAIADYYARIPVPAPPPPPPPTPIGAAGTSSVKVGLMVAGSVAAVGGAVWLVKELTQEKNGSRTGRIIVTIPLRSWAR